MNKAKSMQKLKLVIVLTTVLGLSSLLFSTKISAVAVDPTEISTCAGLLAIDDSIDNINKGYVLTANINCAGVANFTPIGLGSIAWGGLGYSGVFDGQDHSISNLTINSVGVGKVGLFSLIEGGTIKNLILESGSVNSDGNDVGSLVGELDGGGVIDRVCSHISVTGSATSDNVGGLVGTFDGTMSRSCATGDVSGDDAVGGLIGESFGDSIDKSFATGTVTADNDAGGLVGYNDSEEIMTDSYSLSNLVATNDCGGIVGNSYWVEAFRTYYAGTLTCGGPNGLVGYEDDIYEFTDSFWDLKGGANPVNSNGDHIGATVGHTTADMKNINTYKTDINLIQPWDFDTVWAIDAGVNNGYPYLRDSFTATVVVDDLDGINTEVEDAAPNGGDANNDGTPDGQQAKVSSFVSPVSGKYVVLESSGTCGSNSSVLIESESLVETEDDDVFDYPAGLLDFSLSSCGVGATETITQYYFGDLDVNNYVVRKHDKITNTYSTVDGAVLSTVTIGGEAAIKAVYTVTDGGTLDADGVANGTIVDPVGLGQAILAETGTAAYVQPLLGITLAGTATALIYASRRKIVKVTKIFVE